MRGLCHRADGDVQRRLTLSRSANLVAGEEAGAHTGRQAVQTASGHPKRMAWVRPFLAEACGDGIKQHVAASIARMTYFCSVHPGSLLFQGSFVVRFKTEE